MRGIEKHASKKNQSNKNNDKILSKRKRLSLTDPTFNKK